MAIRLIYRVIEAFMVLCLTLMMVLVFGNVVLRYGFNSGIAMSEEVSRMLFVWMTFLGAIIAMRERAHLGMEALVTALPPRAQKPVVLFSTMLMLSVTVMFLHGSWLQAKLNMDMMAASIPVPISVLNIAGIISGVGIALVIVENCVRILGGGTALVQDEEEFMAVSGDCGEKIPTPQNGSDK